MSFVAKEEERATVEMVQEALKTGFPPILLE